jgi:hypothetical protein
MNHTFRDFLFEFTKTPAQIADEILEHCLPYVNAVGDIDYYTVLYRGTASKLKDFEVRERKSAGGMTANFSEERDAYLNEYFKKKHGMDISNIIFATGDPEHARMFGNPFVIFPTGAFKYAFSKTNKTLGSDIHSAKDVEAAKFISGVCDDDSEDGQSDPLFVSAIENNAEVLIQAGGYYPIQLAYWKQHGQSIMENLAFR